MSVGVFCDLVLVDRSPGANPGEAGAFLLNLPPAKDAVSSGSGSASAPDSAAAAAAAAAAAEPLDGLTEEEC